MDELELHLEDQEKEIVILEEELKRSEDEC